MPVASISDTRAPLPPLRIVFCGMRGAFSTIPLTILLEAQANIVGVVVAGEPGTDTAPIVPLDPPRPASPLPLLNPHVERTIVQLAWARDLPVIALNQPASATTRAWLTRLRPDVAIVACFTQRIPLSLLAIPRFGFLNAHPSLLPQYRGPAPQFWVFRNGERTTGVTIHVMDQGLDTGPIVAQARLALPNGIGGAEAENRSAALGGQLLIETVRQLAAGTLEARPQPSGGSQQGWPQPVDWTISAAWPARRIFNFMRGTAEWNQPYSIDVGGERLALAEALAFEPAQTLEAPIVRLGHTILIQCSPGVLTARMR